MKHASSQKHVATRALRILATLYKSPRTVSQLAQIFGVGKRTIYRDIRLIRGAGFSVEKDRDSLSGVRYRVEGLREESVHATR